MPPLKATDKIILLQGATQLPGQWNYSQVTTLVTLARTQFLDAFALGLPLTVVPLKDPINVLWKIEKR
jgi:hypothetical protein